MYNLLHDRRQQSRTAAESASSCRGPVTPHRILLLLNF